MSAPLLATVAQLAAAVDELIDDGDEKAQLYLAAASGIVRGEIAQYVSLVEDDVVRIRPTDSYTAFLPQLPVADFTQLEVFRSGTWVVFPSASYDVDEEAGIITVFSSYAAAIPSVPRGWRATYSHGYADDEIPDAIVGTVLGLASRAWESPIAVDNERVGQRSIKYLMLETGFRPEETAGLQQFIIPRGN